jgi:xanthine dehydrogenase YagS FAD-binding subunit
MMPFAIHRALDASDAVRSFKANQQDMPPAFHAGGTTLVDLMKLGVVQPQLLIDLGALQASPQIAVDAEGARIGALSTMSELAAHPEIRSRWPLIAQSIEHAASPQIRNVATIGGALLQRTRCRYFRDRSSACNKRLPGAGCAAIGGETRELAILGTSTHCIANHPGDLAVALTALDASVVVMAPDGIERHIAVADLYRLPGDRPDLDTVLNPGELILAVTLPAKAWNTTTYLKLRDRASYAFGLVTVAVSVRLSNGVVDDIRIVLGAVAPRPWRCEEAEAALKNHTINPTTATAAAALCVKDASVDVHRTFKLALSRRAVVSALLSLRSTA